MRTLHLVSHTHWDREWYLTFQQFRLKLVQLVDGLLDLLDRDPNFCYFTLDGQTIVLEDYLHMRPDRREELHGHIQSGRVLIGPWYVLPDEFLVSPEALIRNLQTGDRTAREFGPKMMVGYIPDPFGHIGQMPQILAGFDIQSACVQRGLADEPCEFWWQAPDGARVLMAYLREGYGNAAGLPDGDLPRFTSEVARLRDVLLPHSAATGQDGPLLLMYGTDHMQPAPSASTSIAYTQGKLAGDRLVHSTLPLYLEELRGCLPLDRLPVVQGELRQCHRHHLLPGVLSARMWIKQRNHACETLLEKWAEPFSYWAEALQSMPAPAAALPAPARLADPSAILDQAWKLLLQNHPHDSICGCSIDQVHAEMRPRFDQVEQIGEEITRQSLETIAACADTRFPLPQADRENMQAVLVFNPVAGPRTDWAMIETDLPGDSDRIEIIDEAGRVLPSQTVGLGSRSLIDMQMDKNAFQAALGMVSNGRVMDMVVRNMTITRQADQATLEVVLAGSGETDPQLWRQGLESVQSLLADPSLRSIHVLARSAQATRLLFSAAQVPAFGFRTFWMRSNPQNTHLHQPPARLNPLLQALIPMAARRPFIQRLLNPPAVDNPDRQSRLPKSACIENEFLLVEASPLDGSLTLTDRRSGKQYPGLNRFVDGGDCGDEYNYAPPARDELISQVKVLGIEIKAEPVQQSLEIRLKMMLPSGLAPDRQSRTEPRLPVYITTRLLLTRGAPRLDIETRVDNRARDHRLRVHFPAGCYSEQAWFDGPFDLLSRPVGLPAWDASWVEQPRPEQPQRAFTAAYDKDSGLLLANRGLPEIEVLKTGSARLELALTLLRCVGWLSRDDFSTRRGHAGPMLETPGAQMPGITRFDYSILPLQPGAELLPACQQAFAFNAPLRAVKTSLHVGELASQASLVEVSTHNFVMSAIRMAASRSGLVVRGYNISAEHVGVTLKPWKPFPQAARANLLENAIQPLPCGPDGSVRLEVRAHEIVTLLWNG